MLYHMVRLQEILKLEKYVILLMKESDEQSNN